MKVVEVLKNGRRRVFSRPVGKSKTDPQFKDAVDAQKVMDRFLKTGQLTHIAKKVGYFGDVSDVESLHASLCKISEAKNDFYRLPSDVRKKLGNSVEGMLAFLSNPANDEEAIRLGLKVPKEIPDFVNAGKKASLKGQKTASKEGKSPPGGTDEESKD